MDFAKFYDRQQSGSGYPGRLLPFIKGELSDSHTVLDIGSGTGLIAIPLVRAGYTVTAVEVSMEMIRIMGLNTPVELRSSLKVMNIPWENWEGNMHDAAIMVHSLYSMKDIKKAISLMHSSAGKKIIIVRDTLKMKTINGIIRERLGLSRNRDLNNDVIHVLNSLGIRWRSENISEERKYPIDSIQNETESVMYQLTLDDSCRDRVKKIIVDVSNSSGNEIYFNAVFCDNAYIF